MKQTASPINRNNPSHDRPAITTALTSCRLWWLICLLSGVFACMPASTGTVKQRPVVDQPEEVIPIAEKDRLQQAYQNFTLAAIALTQGDSEAARTYLEAAIEKDPQSVYLHQKMAILLKEIKQFPEALAYAKKACDLDPSDTTSIALTADLYTLTGNDDLALEQYRKVLDKEPENQRIRLLLTTMLVRNRRLQEALDHLDTLIAQNPDLVVAHYYRGRINLELNRYGEAEKSLSDALQLNQGLEPALFDMATLYQMTGREQKAIETYEHLVALYPDNIPARERLVVLYMKLGLKEKSEDQMKEIEKHSSPGDPERQALGLIYLRQGRIDDSIAELEMIVKAWPDDDKSRYYLATAYTEKEDVDGALEQFKRIPPNSKYYINAQIHMAHLLTTREEYDQAIQVLDNAMTVGRDRVELHLMRASVYEAAAAYDEAISAVREGLKLDDNNSELIFRLGVLLDKKGDKAACIEAMERVLEIDPNHADALNYIGYTYAEQGVRLDEALTLIKRALAIRPDSGYIIDSLGWIYYKKGDYDEAIRQLEKAVQFTPDDPTINEHLGDAYRQQQNYEKALHFYQKALSLNPVQEKPLKEKIDALRELLKQPK